MTEPRYPFPARSAEAEAEEGLVVAGAAPSGVVEAVPTHPPRSKWADVWSQFRSHKGAVLGLFFLAFVTLAVIFGPYVWTLDPTSVDIRARDMQPVYNLLWNPGAKADWAHPLGTDNLGKDTLAKLISGGRVSMAVGWTAMLLSLLLGTVIGITAGYFRRLDGPLMRLTDLFLSLPLLPLLLVMVLLFRDSLRKVMGPEEGIFILIVVAIGVTSWMQTARIVRGDVLTLKEREFILAARSIGTTSWSMIRRHMLPNVMSPIMVSATLGLANAIITELSLSFLGLGFPPDFPTWGKLLYDSVDRMQQFPERVIWPGLMISLTVLSVNYIGDGLRDALDPRLRGR